MRYKCINAMEIEKYDENGFPTGNFGVITEGSIWYEDDVNMIGGEVHLECESGCEDVGWIEITQKDLEDCFETIIKI